jgi:branched-chain amino acid transport system permease protein
MQRINTSLLYKGLMQGVLKPLGQILLFISGGGLALSVLMVLLAFIFRGSAVDQLVINNNGIDLMSYTVNNLPQVLIDGVTLGFVYAAIALGYTMVYGVLEFINFAHSEIFAIGAFVGVEILIAVNNAGKLAGVPLAAAYAWLVFAIIAGMAAAGLSAVVVERIAYRPLRRAPRLVRQSGFHSSFRMQSA